MLSASLNITIKYDKPNVPSVGKERTKTGKKTIQEY